MLSRRRAIGAIGAAAALLPLHALRAQTPTVVTLGTVPADDAATPVLWALHTGMFAKAGLDVQIQRTSSGAATTAGVVGGAFEIGKSSTIPLLNAHLHGLPVAIIAPASVWTPKSAFAGLVVLKDGPIHVGKDLDGQLIGLQSLNDISELAVNSWVDRGGGDSSTVRKVEMPMGAMGQALIDHRIVAGSLVEPVMASALATGQLRLLPDTFGGIGPHYLFASWFTTKAWAGAHPDVVRTFARVTEEAAVYTNAHPADTAAIVSDFTKIPLDVVEHMTRTTNGSTPLQSSDLQPVIDAAVRYHVIPTGFPADDLLFKSAS